MEQEHSNLRIRPTPVYPPDGKQRASDLMEAGLRVVGRQGYNSYIEREIRNMEDRTPCACACAWGCAILAVYPDLITHSAQDLGLSVQYGVTPKVIMRQLGYDPEHRVLPKDFAEEIREIANTITNEERRHQAKVELCVSDGPHAVTALTAGIMLNDYALLSVGQIAALFRKYGL